MKLFSYCLIAGLSLFAQTPAPKTATPKPPVGAAKPAAAKPAAAKPAMAATKAPAKFAGPPRALLNPALLKAKAPETYKARFTTTKGDFVVQVTRANAPLGADRFYNLVKNGFFNDAAFFRVLPGFVAQFGLSPFPAVSRVWKSANLTDDPVRESNRRGALSFATAGPNTRTTQLFINLADNLRLDGMGFAAFGSVVEGMDVVDKFYTGYGESPDQSAIQNEGKPYLDKNFPQLDSVRSAVIVEAPPAAPAPAAAKPVAPKPVAPKPAPAKTPAATPTKK